MSGIKLARDLIRLTPAASLGTLDPEGGPFVTLVNVAAESPVAITVLLSRLARHTRNLDQNGACSLLLVSPAEDGEDPLTLPRITLRANAERVDRAVDATLRELFLQRHPSAAMYADFGDFGFFRLSVGEAHLVAGFGQIETFTAAELQAD
ncbi:pyridoxamine 5'-phosphate oxidase [Roseiconus nitratireducens]|uniref:Pyridoxamine 5'-phosphate oxidase n=1 Tax=Roseiconus nitratireducens TaxID=2605748 RepID=A0A5M6D735_9BACT|nr:pyridoxamine 5'-phosphate oxidase family protein [Roseiconus nitratireducens]KAA5543193.1 pyridoxamine 5'-phosphate oxidase [Roseiconus nitratireducens]